jgi:hypothetical protein
MRLPRLRFTVRTLLFAAAITAGLLAFSTRPRDAIAFVAVIVAGLLTLFTRFNGAAVRSPQEAIRIATGDLRKRDAAFRPEKHMARAYMEFGLPLWTVDFYPVYGASVVKRVKVTDRGVVRGSASFREDAEVQSLKESPPIYLLDRDGTALDATVRLT